MINSSVLNRELNLPRKCVVLEVTLCSFVKLYLALETQAEERDSSEDSGELSRL
jgi:hypothetical protein